MARDPLELATRRRAYDLVASVPGLHLREVARRLDVDVRTAQYHLEHLGKHGLVAESVEGGFRRFFPRTEGLREVVDARDRRALGLLRRPVPLYVALLLLTRGAATHGEIAQGADVSASTVSYHLARLEREGVVGREGDRYALRDPNRIARLLYAHRPEPDLLDRFADLWQDFTL